MMWDYDSYKDLDERYYDPFKSKYEQEELSFWRESKYDHTNDELLKKLKKELNDEKNNKKLEFEFFIFELIFFFMFAFFATLELSFMIWFFINMKGLL